ncbi:DMT family transporter [Marinomonas fungiae]|uniref:EamA-like transporter family n=1 Tax=Marinomonas fungiae TaxID=1137284 RepID=A0A0K6ISE3_9GAMM|nr:DMT family transporter [Marinomonas fungiae]CUB06025.1 EamA-like transporter family [Marinomonas fungiae]
MFQNTVLLWLARWIGPKTALFMVTVVWGGTFVVVKFGITLSSPMFFVACRFLMASLVIGILSFESLRRTTKADLIAAIAIGLSITAGYGSQTVGMQYITSSESAFITALYVPLVPFILFLVFKKVPHYMTCIGALVAFMGLVVLSGGGSSSQSMNFGHIITALSTIALAIEIILISHFAPSVNLKNVTILQLFFAAVFAFISMPIVGETAFPDFSWALVGIIGGLSLASACIQLTMNWAQRSVDSSTAAIIYAGEPVWAGIIGRIAGERLPAVAMLGGVFVVLGLLISEYRPRLRKRSVDSL